jgi:general secretion pathway protein N
MSSKSRPGKRNHCVTATEIRISAGQLQLNDFYLKLPASALGELSAYLRPVKLGGSIVLKSDSMKISAHQLLGTLVGDWTGAYSGLSSLSPLGNYRFVISGSETGGDLSLATTSGMLILNGKGQFDSAGVVKFNAHAQAAEGQQEKLAELLRHLGPEISPGQHTLTLTSN